MNILCAGQLVADTVVYPVEAVDFGVDTVLVDRIEQKPGGDALNVAVNAARLGNAVRFAGLVGDDPAGAFLRRCLEEAGVDARGLLIDRELPSSGTIVLVNRRGERTFLHAAGANQRMRQDLVRDEWIAGSGILYVGGTFILPAMDGEGTAELFRRARNAGALTAMDVTHDSSNRWMEIIRPSLEGLDYFLPSQREAAAITGRSEPGDMASSLLDAGVKTVVIKLGARGCFVRNREEGFYQKTFDVPVLDTTGAGDSFVAGFLTGLAAGKTLRECAELGCAAGSVTVQYIGANTGELSRDRVNELINNKEK